MSRLITVSGAVDASDAERAKFPVRSLDPAHMSRLTCDFILDATIAAGHQSGSLPADAANVGTLVDVGGQIASGAALPSGLRGAVTAAKNTTDVAFANSGSAGGIGLTKNGGGATTALKLAKAGVADNEFARPDAEGFEDFLVIVWAKPTSLTSTTLIGVTNNNAGADLYRYWGVYANAGAAVFEAMSGRQITGLAVGSWFQLGLHYAFDTGTGEIFVRIFINGEEFNASAAETAVTRTTSDITAAADAHTKFYMLGDGYNIAWKGLQGRMARYFTGQAGDTLAPLLLVQQDYAANLSWITGA